MNLKHLTDSTLLKDTKDLALRERLITSQLLHHLREIERRRLFSELGYSSLFDYLVKELNFSEASASRRVRAARILKEIPQVEMKIIEGSLNLSNLSMASQLFKNEGITNKEKKKEYSKSLRIKLPGRGRR